MHQVAKWVEMHFMLIWPISAIKKVYSK